MGDEPAAGKQAEFQALLLAPTLSGSRIQGMHHRPGGIMKNHFAPLLGMALVLTACSGGGNEAVPAETATEATPASASPTPSATLSSASTTAAPTPSVTPSPAPARTTPPPAPAPTQSAPPPAAVPPVNPQTSPRGNLIKEVGELAGVRDANGEYLVTFTVNDIIVDVPCTDPYADAPENGHFVAVDVSVETSPNMLNSDLIQQFSMSSLTFQAIGPDGITSNAGTDSAATLFCLDDSVLLPGDIGPGEKANGLVLLDVEHPTGTLVYEDFWTDSGWEYAY